MSRLSSFGWGVLGGFLVLAAALILFPLYSDYRSRAHVSEALELVKPLQRAVETRILASGVVHGSGIDIDTTQAQEQELAEVMVLRDGELVLRDRYFGQVLVLVPSINNAKVSWVCLGGSPKDVPTECRIRPRDMQ